MDEAERVAAKAHVESMVYDGGGLYSLGRYLWWEPRHEHATLDGDFTAAELRAIADYMDEHATPIAAQEPAAAASPR